MGRRCRKACGTAANLRPQQHQMSHFQTVYKMPKLSGKPQALPCTNLHEKMLKRRPSKASAAGSSLLRNASMTFSILCGTPVTYQVDDVLNVFQDVSRRQD